MGLFDEVHCRYPLPDDAPEFVRRFRAFQTYDLGRGMGEYTITEEGQLCASLNSWRPGPIYYKRKRLELYASNLRGGKPTPSGFQYYTENGEDYVSIVYVVQIRDGKVSSIKEKWRRVLPARPMKEFAK